MTRITLQPRSLKDPRPRYSQGIAVEGARRLIFIAGQTAADDQGRLVGQGDIDQQVERVFQNLGAVLGEAGASFAHLVQTTTYVTSLAYRDAYNRGRLKYYGSEPPANTLIAVSSLGHEDFLIEVEGIAVI